MHRLLKNKNYFANFNEFLIANKNVFLNTLLYIGILLPYFGAVALYLHFESEKEKIATSKFIIIDKQTRKLTVYSYTGTRVAEFPINLGANYGTKQKKGDLKTPEGVFPIMSIEDASGWKYDFEDDGQGPVEGAYGPLFFRLQTPFRGIGIHGTHEPEAVEKARASHGCVRMKNEELLQLKDIVGVGTIVVITPSVYDLLATGVLKKEPKVIEAIKKSGIEIPKAKNNNGNSTTE